MASSWVTSNPIDHTLNSAWPEEVRNLKDLLKSRVLLADAEPIVRPSGAPFEANDNGSIWIDSNSTPDNLMYVLTDYSVPTWTLMSVSLIAEIIAVANTWAGIQTFSVSPVFTLGVVANQSYLQGRNNAGDGNVDMIKVNAADEIALGGIGLLADESRMATTALPTTDTMIANKIYADTLATGQVCRMYDSSGATANGSILVELDTDSFDPAAISNTGTFRMTPTIAGYYQVNGIITWTSGLADFDQYGTQIYKNGSAVATVINTYYNDDTTTDIAMPVSDIVHCNGSTDYLQLYTFSSEEANYTGGTTKTFMSIALISTD